MTDPLDQERAILETASAELHAQGFDVVVHPSKLQLPPFLSDLSPDAIAMGSDKNLVIQVATENHISRQRLEAIRERLSKQERWELRVYSILSSETPKPVGVVSAKSIEASLVNVEQLTQTGQLSAGLLVGWATFEALGRALLPDQFRRPQTPGRLVEVLASRGQIGPSAADKLRQLASARNRVIHGGLDVELKEADLDEFLSILISLGNTLSAEAV